MLLCTACSRSPRNVLHSTISSFIVCIKHKVKVRKTGISDVDVYGSTFFEACNCCIMQLALSWKFLLCDKRWTHWSKSYIIFIIWGICGPTFRHKTWQVSHKKIIFHGLWNMWSSKKKNVMCSFLEEPPCDIPKMLVHGNYNSWSGHFMRVATPHKWFTFSWFYAFHTDLYSSQWEEQIILLCMYISIAHFCG